MTTVLVIAKTSTKYNLRILCMHLNLNCHHKFTDALSLCTGSSCPHSHTGLIQSSGDSAGYHVKLKAVTIHGRALSKNKMMKLNMICAFSDLHGPSHKTCTDAPPHPASG